MVEGTGWRSSSFNYWLNFSAAGSYMEANSGFTVDARGITENDSANRILWKDLTNFGITEETRGPTIKIPIRLVQIDSAKQSFRTRYGLLNNAHVLLALCAEMSTSNT